MVTKITLKSRRNPTRKKEQKRDQKGGQNDPKMKPKLSLKPTKTEPSFGFRSGLVN